ncbi:MAG: DeoR/GlpR family DNA-binding transcription regulator [Culicoidibacterales bacterium]
MIARQRHEKILALLETKEYASILELTEVTLSSEATVRRDLLKLEDEGVLERLHGGASIRKNQRLNELSIQTKLGQAMAEKARVARYVAYKYLKNDSVIFLDAGSATGELIPYFRNRNLTVVTNGIHHIPRLLEVGVKTIVLGGNIKPTTQAVVGPKAIKHLNHYAFDYCFIGANAIDEHFGCSTPDEAESAVKQVAIQQSAQTLILADSSKFGHRSFSYFCDLEQVTIITDSCPKVFQNYPKIEVITE